MRYRKRARFKILHLGFPTQFHSGAHMSNTPDLRRVVFISKGIESDCDRNRKWAQGA